ncbi:MAG: hypothetical protein C9356_14305 [Oleiphilus sp.]|nr:MAG: hypothetical protein C9356_14305 [Oleiphilus sp.]
MPCIPQFRKLGYLTVLLLFFASFNTLAKNGFDLAAATIPVSKIHHGGPPKDGIPAIDHPSFVPADQASYLRPEDRILGFTLGKVARAYPIRLLNWHEIVNDHIDGFPFVITYCPLCGTGMAFEAQQNGTTMTFGVSGLLYQSDVLLYDRQSQSLWSQIMGQAVSGPKAGHTLTQLPLAHLSWQQWREQHPNTQVLSQETGYLRDYSRDPYRGYGQSKALYFEVDHQAPDTYHPKEWVLGIKLDKSVRAYPFAELSRAGRSVIVDQVGNQNIKIFWDEESRSAYATDAKNNVIVSTSAYWFAWYTFYPQTTIYRYQPEEN